MHPDIPEEMEQSCRALPSSGHPAALPPSARSQLCSNLGKRKCAQQRFNFAFPGQECKVAGCVCLGLSRNSCGFIPVSRAESCRGIRRHRTARWDLYSRHSCSPCAFTALFLICPKNQLMRKTITPSPNFLQTHQSVHTTELPT